MSKRKKNRVVGLCFFLLAFLVMIGLTGVSEVGAAEKVLKIGSVMPISGPQAAVGLTFARGYDIFAEWINSQGGLTIGSDKYKVKMINEDSGMNPEIAASSATKLVHKDGVKFVIGAIIDPCGEAIYGVTAPAKALHVSSFLNIPGGPADVNQSRPLKVRLNILNNMVHTINYGYLTKTFPKVKTVVLLEMNIGLDPVLEHRKSIAEKYGIKVLATELYPLESFDMYPIHTRLLRHRPDAIDIGNSPPDHAVMHVKTARELGFTGPIFHHSPMDTSTILRAVGPEKAQKVFGAGVDITSPKNITKEMRIVQSGWVKKYKEPFVSESFMAFDVAWTLSQAIQKAQSLDPAAVVRTLEKMKTVGDLKTVYGPGHMGGLKTFGVNQVLVRPVPLSAVKGNAIDLVSLTLPKLP